MCGDRLLPLVALGVQWQVHPGVGTTIDLCLLQPNAAFRHGGQQRGESGPRHELQPNRQLLMLLAPVDDAIPPVDVLDTKRRFPIHFNSNDLGKVAFGRERQDDRFAQHFRAR